MFRPYVCSLRLYHFNYYHLLLMSLDFKRRLSDISEDGPTKKLRSEDLDLPSRADIASMPTDMSPSPQLTSEERKHPPELTWAEYQDCLQLLQSIPSALTDPIIWLQRMLSFISERKPGICAPVEMAGALLRDDPELRAHLVRRDFESALNSRECSCDLLSDTMAI